MTHRPALKDELFILGKTSVDKPLLEYMSKKLSIQDNNYAIGGKIIIMQSEELMLKLYAMEKLPAGSRIGLEGREQEGKINLASGPWSKAVYP